MSKIIQTVEDCINALVSNESIVNVSDLPILKSIARQISRGVALTDRQHNLMKLKLEAYRCFFEKEFSVDFGEVVNALRLPLRMIDRTHEVFIDKSVNKIVVRFPFSKKTITDLEKISSVYRQFYTHQKGTNEHFFDLYEPLIEAIVDTFSRKSFTIDPALIKMATQIKAIQKNAESFVPQLMEDSLVNISPIAAEMLEKEIGKLTKETYIKYVDRSKRYGFAVNNPTLNGDTLTVKLALRSSHREYVAPALYSLEDVVKSLHELDRFPLLVVLDNNHEFSQLKQMFSVIKDYVPAEKQILLNRIEDTKDPNYRVNKYIKEAGFNNWLDENIKVTYIFQQRLPKILLKNEWKPLAAFYFSGVRPHSNVSTYVEDKCDLAVAYDNQRSFFDTYNKRQLNDWV